MSYVERIELINELIYNAKKIEHFSKENWQGVLIDDDIEDKRQKFYDYYKKCYKDASEKLLRAEIDVDNQLQNAKNDFEELKQAKIIDC